MAGGVMKEPRFYQIWFGGGQSIRNRFSKHRGGLARYGLYTVYCTWYGLVLHPYRRSSTYGGTQRIDYRVYSEWKICVSSYCRHLSLLMASSRVVGFKLMTHWYCQTHVVPFRRHGVDHFGVHWEVVEILWSIVMQRLWISLHLVMISHHNFSLPHLCVDLDCVHSASHVFV